MAIQEIEQPEIIRIDDDLRLRKYDGIYDFAFSWYQDEETVYLVDGVKNKYTLERLGLMYNYLNNAGELYFIEVLENGTYTPIGDVTFCKEDMPIVIGDSRYRGKGIGRKVISTLVTRARELGFDHVGVGDIYSWNTASRRCFESIGFMIDAQTEKGSSYRMQLD